MSFLSFKKSSLKTVLIFIFIVLNLGACNFNTQTDYPKYKAVENAELNVIELYHENIIYRPYGIFTDNKYRGEQIGIREDEPQSKICKAKGYDSSEWIIEYLDVFMGGGDMLFKAIDVTKIPSEFEQFKEYDF